MDELQSRIVNEQHAAPARRAKANEQRHARRIAQLAEYETTGSIAGHEID